MILLASAEAPDGVPVKFEVELKPTRVEEPPPTPRRSTRKATTLPVDGQLTLNGLLPDD